MTDIVDEIEGVISDIKAGVANHVSAGKVRRVAHEIEHLQDDIDQGEIKRLRDAVAESLKD